ncbi:MAG: acyl carrier protein [candidate division NC10 bacterium]|nr:acyl carrier protein [candidate division NC10 bacterium]
MPAPAPTPGSETKGAAAAEADAILAALRTQIAVQSRGRLAPEDVDVDVNVCDYGYLDSLSYVEFLLHVETTFGVWVLDVQFVGRFNTLRALAAHIAAVRPGAAG